MNNQVFIDGVGEIRLIDGVMRMDLIALSPTLRNDDGGLAPEFVQQLVMSPEAFLRMIRSLGATVQSLQERGVLNAPGDGESEAAEPEEDDGAAASPNFG